MKYLKWILIGIVIIGAIIGGILIFIKTNKSNKPLTNAQAEKDKDNRYITIVNGTNQIINEAIITVGLGSEVEKLTNPNGANFVVLISEEFSNYTDFTITLIDRYGLKYVKEISDVKKTGRTEVMVTEDDYVKEKGDTWDKIDKFFNGD